MPGYNRAEVSVEIEVVPSPRAETPPREQVEAGLDAAGATGLAREAGPESTVLSGGREQVLDAARGVIEAALDAGASKIRLTIEAHAESGTFGGAGGRR